jgi:uncharacterized protein
LARVAAVPAAVSERVRVRRGPTKGRYDRESLEAVLDQSLIAHVAVVDGDTPICVPMLFARIGDALYIHSSSASRLVRRLSAGASACVTVTRLRGLVLARSAFEHSANYESAMIFGSFAVLGDDTERLRALEAFTEKLLPGRWSEVRAPSTKELKASAILALDLGRSEASVKVRSGPPDDDDSPDAARDTWAGVLPVITFFGRPEPSPGLRQGIPESPSITRIVEVHGWA